MADEEEEDRETVSRAEICERAREMTRANEVRFMLWIVILTEPKQFIRSD